MGWKRDDKKGHRPCIFVPIAEYPHACTVAVYGLAYGFYPYELSGVVSTTDS